MHALLTERLGFVEFYGSGETWESGREWITKEVEKECFCGQDNRLGLRRYGFVSDCVRNFWCSLSKLVNLCAIIPLSKTEITVLHFSHLYVLSLCRFSVCEDRDLFDVITAPGFWCGGGGSLGPANRTNIIRSILCGSFLQCLGFTTGLVG